MQALEFICVDVIQCSRQEESVPSNTSLLSQSSDIFPEPDYLAQTSSWPLDDSDDEILSIGVVPRAPLLEYSALEIILEGHQKRAEVRYI